MSIFKCPAPAFESPNKLCHVNVKKRNDGICCGGM